MALRAKLQHHRIEAAFKSWTPEKFMGKVAQGEDADCWLWTGEVGKFGHVLFVLRTAVMAHKHAYELFVGPIPDGLVVRHKCDVPGCVNPKHLELGTLVDNRMDAVERRRHARGESHGSAKLTAEDVREIRKEAKRIGRFGCSTMARKYGLHHSTVRKLVKGRTWKDVV